MTRSRLTPLRFSTSRANRCDHTHPASIASGWDNSGHRRVPAVHGKVLSAPDFADAPCEFGARMKNLLLASLLLVLAACGSDSKAAASCTSADDCPDEQTCLTNFKGGYCGTTGCSTNADCADGTQCVSYEGSTYCFLACNEKSECNDDRGADEEANCSSNIDLAEGGKAKACVPPSGS